MAGTYKPGVGKWESPCATRAIQRRLKGSSARHQPRSRKLAGVPSEEPLPEKLAALVKRPQPSNDNDRQQSELENGTQEAEDHFRR